jgi:hypothetical protein
MFRVEHSQFKQIKTMLFITTLIIIIGMLLIFVLQQTELSAISVLSMLILFLSMCLGIELSKQGVYIKTTFDNIEKGFLLVYSILYVGMLVCVRSMQHVEDKVKFTIFCTMLVSIPFGLVVIGFK